MCVQESVCVCVYSTLGAFHLVPFITTSQHVANQSDPTESPEIKQAMPIQREPMTINNPLDSTSHLYMKTPKKPSVDDTRYVGINTNLSGKQNTYIHIPSNVDMLGKLDDFFSSTRFAILMHHFSLFVIKNFHF